MDVVHVYVLTGRVLLARRQIGTTKGTGGDVLILEEAAYCDEGVRLLICVCMEC